MMLRYFDNEEETHRIMVKHNDGLTWIHTQDIGYITEDGILFVVDRIKRMIVRHDGFKVFPSKIETMMRCILRRMDKVLVIQQICYGHTTRSELLGSLSADEAGKNI